MSIKANLSAKSAVLQKKNSKKGFTLVELVIVIAVLAIIAAIAIPTVVNVITNANKSTDITNAQTIENTIKTAESEVAANGTTKSDRADALIKSKTPTITFLLQTYGVDPTIMSSPKTTGAVFHYIKSTGKVIACKDDKTLIDGTEDKNPIIKADGKYTITGDELSVG